MITYLASQTWNVENTSYLPFLFFIRMATGTQARKYILYLAWTPPPREENTPKFTFGIIEGIVQGLMGITPDARTRTISTIFKMTGKGNAAISQLSLEKKKKKKKKKYKAWAKSIIVQIK